MKTNLQQRNHSPKSVVRVINAALVSGVGVIDYLTGVDVSVIVFYWFPISIGTWFGGRRTRFFLAGASAVVWLLAEFLNRTTTRQPLVPIWNSIMLGSAVVVSLICWERSKTETGIVHPLSAQASVSGSWLGCKPN